MQVAWYRCPQTSSAVVAPSRQIAQDWSSSDKEEPSSFLARADQTMALPIRKLTSFSPTHYASLSLELSQILAREALRCSSSLSADS
jgi:hypothetical protein